MEGGRGALRLSHAGIQAALSSGDEATDSQDLQGNEEGDTGRGSENHPHGVGTWSSCDGGKRAGVGGIRLKVLLPAEGDSPGEPLLLPPPPPPNGLQSALLTLLWRN